MHPTWEYQQALYDTLLANTELTSIISGVYTSVPEASSLPYLVIAQTDEEPILTSTSEGVRAEYVLVIYGTADSNESLYEAANAISVSVANVTPSEHTVITQQITNARYERSEDEMRYRLTLEVRLEKSV